MYGNLIEVLAGLLIFSLGIPAFILQVLFPENLRSMVWKIKAVTVVPVFVLTAGYLYALYRACLGARFDTVDSADLESLIWLTFGLVAINAAFFVFLCVVPPLDAMIWLFKRRVVGAAGHRRSAYLADFVAVAEIAARKRSLAALCGDFGEILDAFLEDVDYVGSSLDRYFASLEELFLRDNVDSQHSAEEANEFLLESCRRVVLDNSEARSRDPLRLNCPDIGFAVASVQRLASKLIGGESLLSFRRTVDFLSKYPDRLCFLLLETVRRKASVEFGCCLGAVRSALKSHVVLGPVAREYLGVAIRTIEKDGSWVAAGNLAAANSMAKEEGL
jgi:hypothetical protein